MDKLKESHRLLHSFCIRPKLRFDGQGDKEKVLLVLRAHPLTQIYWLINGLIFFSILVLLNIVITKLLDAYQILFFDLFGLVIILYYLWFNFLSWFFNVGIVTSERIIDMDYSSVLFKEVTIAMLNKVEDLTSKSAGFFSSIFDYGNVFIQTAGTEANIEFMNIPRPSETVKIINDILNQK